jgi:hypothetical protein
MPSVAAVRISFTVENIFETKKQAARVCRPTKTFKRFWRVVSYRTSGLLYSKLPRGIPDWLACTGREFGGNRLLIRVVELEFATSVTAGTCQSVELFCSSRSLLGHK